MMNTTPGSTGRYDLQELLGQGGMSEVWKAFDPQAGRPVAIKFLHTSLKTDPDFVARFQRESQVIASLHHPNIVQYHDFSLVQPAGAGNVTANIVMEYVDGGTLDDCIRDTSRQGKFLPIADVVRLFTSIGAALDYAHQRGIVHGQLKPTNILFNKLATSRNAIGEPVITDFGTIKLLAGTAGGTSGWWMGTPLYTSPEQVMGSPGDIRSDIYSLGIMLYEVCTGTPPFPGNNPATIMMQQINTIPASPALINPGIPPALTTLIMRSIAKDPALRFPTIASMMTDLAKVLGQDAPEMASPAFAGGRDAPDVLVLSGDLPTVLSSNSPSPLPGITPAFPAPMASGGQAIFSSSPSWPGGVGTIPTRAAVPPSAGPMTPILPPFEPRQLVQNLPTMPVPPPPVMASPQKSRRRGLWIALSVLLALVVIGSGLGAYFTFFSKSASTGPQIVGHAYFISSGLLSSTTESSQGITDELEIKLNNIPPPQVGKRYYAWLLNPPGQDWQPISLGALTVTSGTIFFTYPGDAAHTNLLAENSRFLVTEENVGPAPVNPSLDANSLRYYAAFSQVKHPDGANLYSLYDHIRHLLANDPKVEAAKLVGGLDIWLYRNTQKILEWAGSARDAALQGDSGTDFIRRQLNRIIDYLDGINQYSQKDLQGQQPVSLPDPTAATIGLLTFDEANQDPPGYLYHIDKHLHEISILPESSPEQRSLALQISQDINIVTGWDQQMRSDILELLGMDPAQWTVGKGLALLDEVATLANIAFVGQENPQGQVTAGIVQIHYAIQSLATFDVRACTTSDPCPALV